MEKNSVYLVKINCLLAELRREIHQLIFILSQVVHLHEVVVVLKLAEDGVLLAECPVGGVKKFLLNRLVEFSIKWVGGYRWSTKEKCEKKDM